MRIHIYLCLSLQKALTGIDDLQQVKALEMQVDTRENSLGNFGKKTIYPLLTFSNFPLLYLSRTGDSEINSQYKVLSC